uniref:(northern house mosquito) hypothetical protein n=1 Tax=Culex pipiens TaxID=7175 RepID=A0A8D8B5U4_CULPI
MPVARWGYASTLLKHTHTRARRPRDRIGFLRHFRTPCPVFRKLFPIFRSTSRSSTSTGCRIALFSQRGCYALDITHTRAYTDTSTVIAIGFSVENPSNSLPEHYSSIRLV